ncbi:hypothetical protein H671_1g3370 [Cricetulus griseus]|uniref:Uncharacterized protein n=1 Tax=Cricetulus griseus TaxID=10029 RepID=A0A061II09_CRIGR|nr:hypothetical protein H671_1g3370 [Cricetulus griseus]
MLQSFPAHAITILWLDLGPTGTTQDESSEGQWFSTFLMLRPINTVPNVVVTPTIKYYVTVINCSVNT